MCRVMCCPGCRFGVVGERFHLVEGNVGGYRVGRGRRGRVILLKWGKWGRYGGFVARGSVRLVVQRCVCFVAGWAWCPGAQVVLLVRLEGPCGY